MTDARVTRRPQELQEYQDSLNRALSDDTYSTDAVIALLIGDNGWLVSLDDLMETSICPDLAKAGGLPPGILGIGNFRGKVNTVVSMPQVLSLPTGVYKGTGWTTVLHPRFGEPLALWWPQMMGLFPRSDFVASTRSELPYGAKASWVSGDSRVWNELDTQQLVSDRFGGSDSSQETHNGA